MNSATRSHGRWEHFPHRADVGIRGFGPTCDIAFEQIAVALTAVITNPDLVRPLQRITLECDAADIELLLLEWLNTLVYEMAVRHMLFKRYQVQIDGCRLTAHAWGEPIDRARHEPACEVKGATLTLLRVTRDPAGQWLAQCVVDV